MIALVPLLSWSRSPTGSRRPPSTAWSRPGAIEVNGQTTRLLIVLMFGAGTDYCLLIVSRYREELRRTEDKHVAMAHAAERTAPAILSAGRHRRRGDARPHARRLQGDPDDGARARARHRDHAARRADAAAGAARRSLGRRAFWPAVPRARQRAERRARGWRRIGAPRARPAAARSCWSAWSCSPWARWATSSTAGSSTSARASRRARTQRWART